ncbi:hypothetical protein D6827_03240 [Candidatus Parcubacteria bacterium]|nr:MAG: hypothetical protein D6827_03240 [Candidatus Parcubacteria bacterium]
MNVSLLSAVSLDGKIAGYDLENSFDWTCPEDKKFFKEKTVVAGVVIMGRKTWETIGHPLSNRLTVVLTKKSGKICISARASGICQFAAD